MNDGDRVSTSPFSPSPFSAFIHSSFRSGKWKRNKSPSANDLSSAAPTDRQTDPRAVRRKFRQRAKERGVLGAEFPVQWVPSWSQWRAKFREFCLYTLCDTKHTDMSYTLTFGMDEGVVDVLSVGCNSLNLALQ